MNDNRDTMSQACFLRTVPIVLNEDETLDMGSIRRTWGWSWPGTDKDSQEKQSLAHASVGKAVH